MAAVLGKVWGWLWSWATGPKSQNTAVRVAEGQKQHSGGMGFGGWTSWMWGGWKHQSEQNSPVEEYWEASEQIQPIKFEPLPAGKSDGATSVQVSSWWNKYLPTSYLWPRNAELRGLTRRIYNGHRGEALDCEGDKDFSDYGTPPPSPTPSSQLSSPFRLFMHSWKVDTLPEHDEICFNFLRHLFDLFVVGFLWTVSPPTKLILEVLGVQGALRLWLHGMAMFFVSTVGMAGLFWLIQEYLPQFALIYGIIQAAVISVSVRQNLILGVDEEKKERDDEETKETARMKDSVGRMEKHVT